MLPYYSEGPEKVEEDISSTLEKNYQRLKIMKVKTTYFLTLNILD